MLYSRSHTRISRRGLDETNLRLGVNMNMTKSRIGLSFLFGAALVAAAGCGDSDSPAGGDGGSGGATTTITNQSSSSGAGGGDGGAGGNGTGGATTSSSSSSSGTGGYASDDGNDTIETATDFTGEEVAADFSDVTKDVDFYRISGKKGDALIAYTEAKVGDDAFDPSYADTIITLYDAAKNQIAQNDDPNPRFTNDATLYSILPVDGDYYIRVAECNAVFGVDNCAPADGVTDASYTLNMGFLKTSGDGIATEGPEADNNAIGVANPVIGFAPIATSPGSYYMTTVYGMFDGVTDADVYSIKLPAGLSVDADSGAMASVYVTGHGSDGNGSAAAVGKLWITDAAGDIIARIDSSSDDDTFRQLSPVLELDTQYYLFVERAAAPATLGHDFYFVQSVASGSNPLEVGDAANDATPEALTAPATQPGSYFIDGTLSSASDVDHYTFAIPSGSTKVSVSCAGARQGSAIQGLKAEVLNGATSVASQSEGAKDLYIKEALVPGGATTLTLKITGTGLETGVSSAFYRCGVHVQ